MSYVNEAVVASKDATERQRAIRSVREKRTFWRQVSWFSVLNAAFWLTWIIGGIREEWVRPWPIIPTVIWGSFILYREHQLGGRHAVSHETIEHEVAELRQADGPVYRDLVARRDIPYGDSAAYQPIKPFHLREVIDAREANAQLNSDSSTS